MVLVSTNGTVAANTPELALNGASAAVSWSLRILLELATSRQYQRELTLREHPSLSSSKIAMQMMVGVLRTKAVTTTNNQCLYDQPHAREETTSS